MNGRRRRLVLAAGAAAALIASRAQPSRAGSSHTVAIDAFEFKPGTLTVRRGDTIVWRNDDPVPHTVTARGAFDSGSIDAGASWKHVAAATGTFDYVCAFHPTMKGRLIVG